MSYLLQAGKGQFALINRAKPISEVLKDERTPPRIKYLLSQIDPIKKFGEKNELKPTRNYTEYVKLDRPYAVWVVSAAERLRFKSKEWSFPIVGSMPYLGWFDLESAKELSRDLREEGWDVDVRGAPAYSTLGWFRDSILSSMIADGDDALGELVNVVLHESVHATFYINGQAYFNESVASFVADHLTFLYLDQVQGPDSKEKKSYLRSEEQAKVRAKKLHEAYDRLNAIYSSNKSDSEKLSEKSAYLDGLKAELGFKREINNATLIQFKEYNTGHKEFDDLYRVCGSNWGRFWKVLKTLKSDSFSESQQQDLAPVMTKLIHGGC